MGFGERGEDGGEFGAGFVTVVRIGLSRQFGRQFVARQTRPRLRRWAMARFFTAG